MSKKNKRRQCPALGKEITSAECGADRISRIACTPDCPFNPFGAGHYDDFGEIEDRFMAKVRDRLYGGMAPERLRAFADLVLAQKGDEARSHYHHLQELHMRKNSAGRNFYDQWEADGWKGLNNDERTIAGGHRLTRPALLEIQCVLSDDSIQAVDFFRPESPPMVIVDRSLAARARRFQALSTWIYPTPSYIRISGAACLMDAIAPCNVLETVQEIVHHLGGPKDLSALEQWFWTHSLRFLDAWEAVRKARWLDMLRGLDARTGTVDYRLRNSAAGLPDLFVSRADFAEMEATPADRQQGFDSEYHVLDLDGAAPLVDAATPTVGSVLLGNKRLRLIATGTTRLEKLKRLIEEIAGGHLEFVSERVDDVAGQMIDRKEHQPDMTLVPPRLLENPQVITLHPEWMREAATAESPRQAELHAMRNFIAGVCDNPVPLLGGLTPRQASADSALRPALLVLMKGHVKKVDDFRKKRGLDLDINPVLEELGLHEIIFPPVPLPDIPEDEVELENDQESFDDTAADLDLDDLPPDPFIGTLANVPPALREEWLQAPSLFPEASPADVSRVGESMTRDYPDSGRFAPWLEEHWPLLFDIVVSATEAADATGRRSLIAVYLTGIVVRLLHSFGSVDEAINIPRFMVFLEDETNRLLDADQDNDALRHAMCDSMQPVLVASFGYELVELAKHPRHPIPLDDVALLLPLLKAVIRELCLLEPRAADEA